MKVLITGGSGLLGQFINICLSKYYDILTLYNSNEGNCKSFNSLQTDLLNTKKLKKTFRDFSPDVVVHTAAISRPEICRDMKYDEVAAINIDVTGTLAELCKSAKAKLIFTSTDLVYDGCQGLMLEEDAYIKPASLYAASKIEAENVIMEIFDDYIILRTSLLYGIGLNSSRNNFHLMYESLKAGLPVRLFYDQYRTPLALANAAEIIYDLIRKGITKEILNFGGKERVSRVELGEILCSVAGFDKTLIHKISMSDVPGLAAVPDVSLNTSKLRSFGIRQNSIEESIKEIILSEKDKE